METTCTTSAPTCPSPQVVEVESELELFRDVVSLRRPIELVALLPYLLRTELEGRVALVYCNLTSKTVSYALTGKLPTDEVELSDALIEVRNLGVSGSEVVGHDSELLGVVAFASTLSFGIADKFMTALLGQLGFPSDSLSNKPGTSPLVPNFHNPRKQPSDEPVQRVAWLVSPDGRTATDLLDPDRIAVSIESETKAFRQRLEFAMAREEREVQAVCELLAGEVSRESQQFWLQVGLARQQRRTSAKFRRQVEDSLYEWLTGDSDPDGELPELAAAWIVGLEDRRIREPLLKRIHNHVSNLPDEQRAVCLTNISSYLMVLIMAGPAGHTAAATSVLALLAWQNSLSTFAKGVIQFGRDQGTENVLLRLVASATTANLPPESWAEIMDSYSLTALRAGK